MHADLDTGLPAPAQLPFDVCVFGSGPAGITVALEVAKARKRVALVEAGGFEFTSTSQKLYEGTESGIFAYALSAKRLRYFGGTSGHWAGRCGLFDEVDFAADTYHGLPGWPISRDDVVANLPEAVSILDLGQQDLTAKPINNARDAIFVHSSVALSPPTRFGQKYRKEIVESPYIHLLTHANLVELKLSGGSKASTALDSAVLRNYSGQTFNVSARHYVLALGAIENARLLLNSDKQVPGGIGNQSGYVGRCFMEHLNVQFGRFVVRDKSFFEGTQLELSPVKSLLQKHRIGNGVLAANPSFIPKDYGRLRHIRGIFRDGACEFETVREFARKFSDFNCEGEGVVNSLLEQCPNPDSRVSLRSDTDSLGLRRANLHWAINDLDRRSIRILGMEFAKEMARLDVARVQLSDFIIDESKSIPIYHHAHHMGTTRMSRDPRHGVVDENVRVHGVENLYVGGSSVFPTGGGTNPTLTIVLLALRLGKHLAQLA